MDHDERELLAVFSRNEKRLRRYFAGLALSREDCEDLTQEAWIKFARNGLAALTAPVPYLMRIARTLAIDHGRTAGRRLTRSEVDELLCVPDERPGPDSIVQSRDQFRRLADIIEELPPRRRRILLASRIEGHPHARIAAEFGVSVRTIEMELRKAIDHCRERLGAMNGM